jgi:trigger factor
VDEKFKTLEDLKNNIRERLNKDLDQRLRNLKINQLLEKIMENTPVEIPESMLRIELDSRWRNLARRFNTDANGLYKIFGNSAEQAESIIENWKPDAVKALHSRLIVETLIEQEKLEAGDDEAEKELETMAGETGTDLEEIKKYYEEENARDYLKEDIKERKLFDLLIAENSIKTGKKEKYLDLISNNG